MIYAIRVDGIEFVKFGKTCDPIKRLNAHQVSCPLQLKLVAVADWPDDEEAKIHMYLDASNERGEWFRNGPAIEKVIGLLRDGEAGLREWQRISTLPWTRLKLQAV